MYVCVYMHVMGIHICMCMVCVRACEYVHICVNMYGVCDESTYICMGACVHTVQACVC